MSLNSKTTTYTALTNLLIGLVIAVAIFLTHNPLAILGLFFLQNMPVFQEAPSMDQLRAMGIIEDDDEDDDIPMPKPTAPADDYAGTKAGFTGRLRSTK